MRSRGRICGFAGVAVLLHQRHASSRASSSAWRLDWVPPLVKTPSAAAAEADAVGVQSMSRRSMRVPPALWSQVSSEELTAESTASPSRAGMTTGQLRWAR